MPPEKVTPLGSAPVSEKVGAGYPLPVTVKVPAVPVVKVVVVAEVITGAWSTTKVNVCVTVDTMLVAVIVTVYVPPKPAAGVPEKLAEPSPLSTRTTPDGSVPVYV